MSGMSQWRENPEGFWSNFEKWRKLEGCKIEWDKNWLKNGYCAQCRLCCGPQPENDPPFPMPLLPNQIGPETPADFYLLNPSTPYIGARGCKSETSTGCRLSTEKKPIACGLFPLVLANGKLYLYQNCPAALLNPIGEFMLFAKEAAQSLERLSLEDLRRLSISLPCEELASKYIDMHILLFDERGKANLLE